MTKKASFLKPLVVLIRILFLYITFEDNGMVLKHCKLTHVFMPIICVRNFKSPVELDCAVGNYTRERRVKKKQKKKHLISGRKYIWKCVFLTF